MANVAEAALLASGARTTTQTLDPFAIPAAGPLLMSMGTPRVLEAVMDTTAAATGSVTLSIEGYDEAKAGWVTLVASAAVVAVGTTFLRHGLPVTPAANAASQGVIPRRWRVVATANNANSQTYSVSARLLAD